jgi:hypothetical protein
MILVWGCIVYAAIVAPIWGTILAISLALEPRDE